ncbi:hypothetical protein PHLGIDRAFT_77771 [Phlebiopsis gigantea 11061_1 CR5-6]|uniref:AB hydrolase-1 domain-containing protein n=1 Tax=Phlebiopsis gigantea (strain 11061_1 CR5-6) TaxID=745531 RepID=A0A0C3RSI0_PHLG1|nr:hypothetical protein PHLGIDRAFT_77771 [Phlebiopsis gigantea 11061_1 CR5-6]
MSPSARLDVLSVCLPPDATYPFYVTAKRYRPADNANSELGASTTLLLMHSTSFHKEIYEPVLASLFARAARDALHIREAWAVECPNHGASATLNAALLLRPPHDDRAVSCERYAAAVERFLASAGPRVHTATDRLVCVGHSLGGCAALFLSARVRLASLVLVDPFLYPGGDTPGFEAMRARLVDGAHERRDVWADRAQAAASLAQRRKWDARVLALFVEHGLRTHPHGARAIAPYAGVTLACTREQEAVRRTSRTMYRDAEGAFKPIAQLDAVCRQMPVHIVFGDRSDVIPRQVQDKIIDPLVRTFASIEWIPDVGHLVPQEAPDAVASFIYKALVHNEKPQTRL